MINIFIIIIALSLAGYLTFSKTLSNSESWRAMVTPLASIIGSGFLISAPLLGNAVGAYAVFFMAILLLLAYAVGGAIRFNIQYFEPIAHQKHGLAQDIAFTSRIVLIGAYFISITYYLQLLSAFVLKLLNVNHDILANIMTTFLLLTIGAVGIWKGLEKLESLEKYTVSLNLGMIGALIFSLIYYNVTSIFEGSWQLPEIATALNFEDMRVLLGLLIVVQGFETSRYLGGEHPAAMRIATMRKAQLISSFIYLVFIGLTTVLFHADMGADVTAIISLTKPVATVLPLLLAIAAIGSQFSASVADNSGAGGLLQDITNKRLPIKYAYLIILAITVSLTWETNINQIIAYASRAFALYYALQCLVAFTVVSARKELVSRRWKRNLYLLLTVVCLLVFLLGVPAG
ncbi:hypothetical protein [Persicobacter diffluens]|uniref:Uncharacterized protein n=1 Tax=Persicobacter diffluens TaxID=981 RepID=A0AAN5AM11_9BACT|nr:hypothetical protein PEDI_51220 [Persicobacter diffluens]